MPRISRSISRWLMVAGLAASLPLTVAVAADAYPTRPIRLIVPSAPGGALDVLGRILANLMQQQSGATVIVDPKPGASGSIGIQLAARAPADGYTFVISVPDAMTIYPLLNTKVTYRWDRDFTPLALVGASSTIYAVSGKSPAKNVAQFLELTTKERTFNYATQGTGTSGHLLMEAFRAETGAKLTHIPYKGIAPAIMAVVSGESQILSSSLASTAPYVASGQLKLIGTTRPQRYPHLPDVPTMAELGYPKLSLETWFGTFAPAGMPPDVRERLIQMLSQAIESPEFKAQAEKYGLEIKRVTGDSFGKMVADDTAFWKAVIDKSHITLD